MQKQSLSHGDASNAFIQKHAPCIQGVLSGFDRLRLRGTLRQLYGPQVMEAYLNACHILIKDFGQLVERTTKAIKDKARALAEKAGQAFPVRSLQPDQQGGLGAEDGRPRSPHRRIDRHSQLRRTVPVLSSGAQSPNQAYRSQSPAPQVQSPLFLFRSSDLRVHAPAAANLVSLPSGRVPQRSPLAGKTVGPAGVAYQKKENTFLRVADLDRAQALLDQQRQTDWPKPLGKLLDQVHPLHRSLCRPLNLKYYWSAAESEYATDVMFQDPDSLARLYPSLVHHAISSFSCADVMRFLGRYVPISTGQVYRQFDGEIISDTKRRLEGVRVKHSLNGNSIKFYDKQGWVLRVETTVVRPEEFKTYRRPEGRPKEAKRWLPLRRGLADMERRAEICHRANERYLQALGSASGTVPLFQWVEKCCKPLTQAGRHYRALNPWAPEDGRLLELINQGEFALNGFRNRDIRQAYFTSRCSEQERQRRMGWVGRRLRLLRAHGLIAKVSGTHRYVVTDKGRNTMAALLAARKADVDQLTKLAA